MSAGRLIDRRLLFVTGKGGVGKTTIAASLALLAARDGKRVLVCDVDASGALASAYEAGSLRFAPTEVQRGVFAMEMDTEQSLKEYLSLQLRMPLLAKIGPLARAFDFVATAAPGVREILTVGKLCWEVKERHYDLVVVDATASGHVVGLLDAPRSINGLVQVGLVRSQTRWMLDILDDAATTGVVIVTTPQEMPVSETIELVGRITDQTDVDVASIVVNRSLPELFSRAELPAFALLESARSSLVANIGAGLDAVFDAAQLSIVRRRSQMIHLDRLRDELSRLPIAYVPELPGRIAGMRSTVTIADRLTEELT